MSKPNLLVILVLAAMLLTVLAVGCVQMRSIPESRDLPIERDIYPAGFCDAARFRAGLGADAALRQ